MVRGVNRTVIEVNCTENAVFERALFFIKPGTRRTEPSLRREADEYVALTGMSLDEPERKRAWWKNPFLYGLLLAISAGLGLAAGAFLF